MTEGLKPLGYISEYGFEKLSTRRHYCVSVSHSPEKEFIIPFVRLSDAEARIKELEAENAALAAHACVFLDGSGVTGDEHGNSVCMLSRRLEAAEALLKEKDGLIESLRQIIDDLNGEIYCLECRMDYYAP